MILLKLFFEFARIGLFTIGGGMASVPFLMDLSERTGWYTQAQLVDMIAVSESTPGPIGINMATYVGYMTAGVWGAIVATLGEVLPSLILVCIIAKFMQRFKDNRFVLGAMYGLRPAATGLIAAAGLTVVLIVIVNTEALLSGALSEVVDLKAVLLAALLLVLTNFVKPTRDLHPALFIAFSAVVGILFNFAGL